MLVAEPNADDGASWAWERLELTDRLDRFVTGIGEDPAGELYVMTRGVTGPVGLSGAVYRVAPP